MTDIRPGVCFREGPITIEDYEEAITALTGARHQLQQIAMGIYQPGCFVCGDSGHTAGQCHHNPLILARERTAAQRIWQCWHCGFEARTDEEAAGHFGRTEEEVARCIRERAGV